MSRIHVIFDGPPGPVCGRFVEVENDAGESTHVGEWEQRGELWALVIDPDAAFVTWLRERKTVLLAEADQATFDCDERYYTAQADAMDEAADAYEAHAKKKKKQ